MILHIHIRRLVHQLSMMQPGLSQSLYRKGMGFGVTWSNTLFTGGVVLDLSSTWPNDCHNYEAMQILQGSFWMTWHIPEENKLSFSLLAKTTWFESNERSLTWPFLLTDFGRFSCVKSNQATLPRHQTGSDWNKWGLGARIHGGAPKGQTLAALASCW